ncbi:UNVERIFIED_CONTAM: hypothetical protein PYX00_002493 [Menopon gallinae]|uniref:DM10 domain-containing protein n=1 Tax=Menopon gallinae TaxID=328185 RepID=A0AAW2IHJ3_9NEOP
MCEKEKEGLPLLPGFSFPDPTKCKFHRSQFFDFKHGGRLTKHTGPVAGKYPRDIDSVRYLDIFNDTIVYDPTLTYGRTREYPLPAFRPHFVTYDKKCLTFDAFFKQTVYNSPDEYYRVRPVKIIYFLDDDTITVMEPTTLNAGFAQGRLIRRAKIPKYGYEDSTDLHWKDFNLGIDIGLCGIVFHITNCDLYTKEFLLSQGVELNDPECMPPDPYTEMRKHKTALPQFKTKSVDDKLRRSIEFDGKLLRFRAVWDDRDSEHGALDSYVVRYYLQDDTVEVAEIRGINDGKDPFPLLLKRTKLPKNWKDVPTTFPSIYMEISDHEIVEYYQPKDFIIGQTIFVYGRRMLLHKCDDETRNYYCKALNINQPENFDIEERPQKKPPEPPPPHTGFGTLEDALASCLHFEPKPFKKDVIKQLVNAGKYLRYSAKLKSTHPEDEIREFVMKYCLSESTISIHELVIRNSGHIGGRFLSSMLVPKPGSHKDYPEYYSPSDFYIGAVIIVNEHKFLITGADLQVYRYMEANPEKFKPEVVDNVRNYLMKEGLLKEDIATIAKSLINPNEFPTDKVCVSDPDREREELQPCPDVPCQPDAEYKPPYVPPPICDMCPPLQECGKVQPECGPQTVPEAHFDDLSGKLIFNRDNPNWK